jgi:hypothetical protein
MGVGTGTVAGVGRDHGYMVTHQMSKAFTYANRGSSLLVGYLPAGAYVTAAKVAVTTLFNGSGTDLVIIGTTDDDDEFASGVDVSSVGVKLPTTLATATEVTFTTDKAVYVKYTDENSNATTGAAVAIVEFIARVG